MEDEEPSIVIQTNEPSMSSDSLAIPNSTTSAATTTTQAILAPPVLSVAAPAISTLPVDAASEKTRVVFNKLIEYIQFHFQHKLHSTNADIGMEDERDEEDCHRPHHFMLLDDDSPSGAKHVIVNAYGLRMNSLTISRHVHVEGDDECDTLECAECHCEGEKTATHIHIDTSFDSRCAGSIDTFSAVSIERAMRLAFDHFKLYKKCSNCYEKHMGPAASNKCAQCTLDELFECPETQCPICLDTTTCFITLPCNTKHKFHHSCWNSVAGKVLLVNGTHRYIKSCPMCRAKIYNTDSGLAVWRQPPSDRPSRIAAATRNETTIRNESVDSASPRVS